MAGDESLMGEIQANAQSHVPLAQLARASVPPPGGIPVVDECLSLGQTFSLILTIFRMEIFYSVNCLILTCLPFFVGGCGVSLIKFCQV